MMTGTKTPAHDGHATPPPPHHPSTPADGRAPGAVADRDTFRSVGGRGAQHTLWLAGLSNITLIAVGIASTYTYTWHSGRHAHHISLGLGVLAGVVAAVAMINFMCFYWIIRQLSEAIAAAVVLTYFILLACMLNTKVQEALNSTSLGASMLTSLTTLTATVGGFYFVGSSYERATKIKAQAQAGPTHPGGSTTQNAAGGQNP